MVNTKNYSKCNLEKLKFNIVEQGTHEELLEKNGLYVELHFNYFEDEGKNGTIVTLVQRVMHKDEFLFFLLLYSSIGYALEFNI